MKRKFAVFDIDGTLFRSHLYLETFLEMIKNGDLPQKTAENIENLLENWRKRSSVDSFSEFEYGVVLGVNKYIKHLSTKSFDNALVNVLTTKRDYVYRYTRDLVKDLKKKDYFLIAISGSHIEAVEAFARHHGFDDWVGQKFHRSPDGLYFTGVQTKTYDIKKTLLEQFIKKHNLSLNESIAVGDSMGDVPMLEMVETAIAFNPEQLLLNYAMNKQWLVVIERKNVIYRLEVKNGSYILV